MAGRPCNTDEPIAFFLTWTAYGTWLPGDERGWHRWGEGEEQSPNDLFQEMAVLEMKESSFVLSKDEREIVAQTISRHCEIRSWILHAVNVRSNHVHVVVSTPGCDPKTVRQQFKAWSTRHLKICNRGRERFWTEGGSCRWINQEDDLESVILYVKDAQDLPTSTKRKRMGE